MTEEQISELIELINKLEELFGKNSNLSLPLRTLFYSLHFQTTMVLCFYI
jgi:hypothetical protein